MIVRAYKENDLDAMIHIWNEVVEEGTAFPQEEFLDRKTGAEFFASQTYAAVAEDESSHLFRVLQPDSTRRDIPTPLKQVRPTHLH